MFTRSALTLAVALPVCWLSANTQEPAKPAPAFKLLQLDSGNVGKVEEAVNRASEDGYVVESGWPNRRLLVMRQRQDSEPRPTYRVLKGKESIQQALSDGYRAVPGVMDATGLAFIMIAYKPAETERYESLLLQRKADALVHDIEQAATKGFRVVGIDSLAGGLTALLERPAATSQGTPASVPSALLVADRPDAIQKELADRAAAGYCVACMEAWFKIYISLERCEAEKRMEYRVLEATQPATLEKELNASRNEGFRFRPGTLQPVQRAAGLLLPGLVAIVEKGPGSEAAGEYRLLSAAGMNTLTREFDEAVAQGYAPVGLALRQATSGEVLVLLQRGRR